MKLKKVNFFDIAVFQMVVILMAFKDYGTLANLSRFAGFLTAVVALIQSQTWKIKTSTFKYVFYRVLFMLWCALSSLWAVAPPSVVKGWVSSVFVRTMVGFAILIYISSEERRDKFIRYMTFAGVVLCIRLFLVVPLSGWGTVRIGKYLAHDKANGYGNTGITYVLGIIAIYVLVFDKLFDKKIRYSLIVLFSLLSFLSGSKKQVFMLMITIVMMMVFKSNNTAKLLRNIVIFVVLSIVVGYAIMKIDVLYNILGQRLVAFFSYFSDSSSANADPSTIGRDKYLQIAWKAFRFHKIIGIGIDGVRYLNPEACWAENNFVELLADVGLIGTFIYYIVDLEILVPSLLRIRQKRYEDVAILVIFAVTMLIDYTMVTYANSTLQFHFAFLYALYALSCNSESRKEKRPEKKGRPTIREIFGGKKKWLTQ